MPPHFACLLVPLPPLLAAGTGVSAMPVMILVLCLMAIAYRYYSAFLAAKVAALDDSRVTPAVRLDDGHNYEPTNKWVLFGHHFAAISGAGPLIGPVLAAQFGYLPGLLWIVIGVCLGGAVQDFLVLAASLRRDGRSLAKIAYSDIGRTAGTAATIAILFILIIALAGLGKVVVMALGGETVKFRVGELRVGEELKSTPGPNGTFDYMVPANATLQRADGATTYEEPLMLRAKSALKPGLIMPGAATYTLPAGIVRRTRGSAWGTFTIAATIPIAIFIGLYMYKIRPGHVVEASLIGAVLTLGATVAGSWVATHPIGEYFTLTSMQVTYAMAIYGFVASVLPVWFLLVPRDYLSSFLKIGTIALLVIGTLIANPKFEAPAINHVFMSGGPTVTGTIFPFLFITIMCGAISGFHSLVSSGTTPKMVKKEGDARMIGYGAMLIEGLVGVVAIIAASSLPVRDYYAMNTDLEKAPAFHDRILAVAGAGGVEHIGDYERLTQESLRGRTGGAVTLAVGMAQIFSNSIARFGAGATSAMESMWKYWFHFAIMFEALFILTTIDAGTRIGRFLVQEVAGKIHPSLGRSRSWFSAILCTLIVVGGWTYFLNSDNFATVWKMFGIANQTLAIIALTVVTAWLVNEGRARYAWVTLMPLLVVMTTTSTAAGRTLAGLIDGIRTQLGNPAGADRSIALTNATIQAGLILAMLTCTLIVLAAAARRIWTVLARQSPAPAFEPAMAT